MTVEAIPITDSFFFWRCKNCGWESERFPVKREVLPPPHDCNREYWPVSESA